MLSVCTAPFPLHLSIVLSPSLLLPSNLRNLPLPFARARILRKIPSCSSAFLHEDTIHHLLLLEFAKNADVGIWQHSCLCWTYEMRITMVQRKGRFSISNRSFVPNVSLLSREILPCFRHHFGTISK